VASFTPSSFTTEEKYLPPYTLASRLEGTEGFYEYSTAMSSCRTILHIVFRQ
jgi:hypothetical protein